MERCPGSRIAHDVAAMSSAGSRVDVPHPFGTDGRSVGVYVRTNELRFRSGAHILVLPFESHADKRSRMVRSLADDHSFDFGDVLRRAGRNFHCADSTGALS
jgi:hypothetical protein